MLMKSIKCNLSSVLWKYYKDLSLACEAKHISSESLPEISGENGCVRTCFWDIQVQRSNVFLRKGTGPTSHTSSSVHGKLEPNHAKSRQITKWLKSSYFCHFSSVQFSFYSYKRRNWFASSIRNTKDRKKNIHKRHQIHSVSTTTHIRRMNSCPCA